MKSSASIKVSTAPMRAFSQGDTLGRILTYCECVNTGTKLLAELLVNRRDIGWVESEIERMGCLCTIDRTHSEDYAEVYLFKYPWVQQLLEESNEKGAPRSAFDHWITGKLFGYSDFEIHKFLDKGGMWTM